MKKKIGSVAASALALGLAFSSAANAAPIDERTVSRQALPANLTVTLDNIENEKLAKRLVPVTKKLSLVELNLQDVSSQLTGLEQITPEQYEVYESKLTSLSKQLNAVTNQLSVIEKKYGENSTGLSEVKGTVQDTQDTISEQLDLIETLPVVPPLLSDRTEDITEPVEDITESTKDITDPAVGDGTETEEDGTEPIE